MSSEVVQLLVVLVSCNTLRQVFHTDVPVTKQYSLVPAKGRLHSAAGKVAAGLAESKATQHATRFMSSVE